MIALVIVTQAQFAFAQKADKLLDNWKLLGMREVDYTLDRDVVGLSPSDHSITGLKLIVKNGTINVHKVTVHFANGDTQDIDLADQVNSTND